MCLKKYRFLFSSYLQRDRIYSANVPFCTLPATYLRPSLEVALENKVFRLVPSTLARSALELTAGAPPFPRDINFSGSNLRHFSLPFYVATVFLFLSLSLSLSVSSFSSRGVIFNRKKMGKQKEEEKEKTHKVRAKVLRIQGCRLLCGE